MIIDHRQTVRWFTFTAYRIQRRQPMHYIYQKIERFRRIFSSCRFAAKCFYDWTHEEKKCLHKETAELQFCLFLLVFFLSFGARSTLCQCSIDRQRPFSCSLLSTGISHACQFACLKRECVKHQHMVRLENACDTIMFNSFFFLSENMERKNDRRVFK